MNTVPDSGSPWPHASCARANASPKSRPMPITSPVLFISGPSKWSVRGKRRNGKDRAFDEDTPGRQSRHAVDPGLGIDFGRGDDTGLDVDAGHGVDLGPGVELDRAATGGEQTLLAQPTPQHAASGDARQRHAGRLLQERHGARGPGVDLDHVDHAPVAGELDVEQPHDAQLARDAARVHVDELNLAERSSCRAAARRSCRRCGCRTPRCAP